MSTSRRWLRGPHRLSILLGIVVALPAVTLVVLGVRLLDQDRALAVQRRAEIVQSSADRAVRALEQELAAVARRLAEPSWPDAAPPAGSISLAIKANAVSVAPAGAIAWYPGTPRLPESPASAFEAVEAAEYQTGDLPRALALVSPLAIRDDAAIRAGALLRQARILRKMSRPADAAAAYRQMADITGTAIEGVPADLVARKALCEAAASNGRPDAAPEEAARLQADLGAGRWRLDRATYELVASRLDEWLGRERRRGVERESAAAAVEWLADARNSVPATGNHTVITAGGVVVVVWNASAERVAAFVGLPGFVEREWRPAAQRAASPATITLTADPDSRATRASSSPGVTTATRTAAETSLPWTVTATLPAGMDVDSFGGRERTLLAGLAAVLLLVAAGGYVVIRSRSHEVELSRLQSDFVAAVSHEFRTPLTTLRQFNELLEDDEQVPADKRRSYHQAQARATIRLYRLVESLLDFGRMEAGRRPYTFEPLDAGALASDLVQEFRAELDGRGFDIRCRVEPGEHVVQADAEALGRAVWNLLDNAVKYSGDAREIDVTVGGAAPGLPERTVAIAVRDRGIGIPPLEQAHIFGRFVRGKGATAARIKGTGIGLAMAQHIVAAHHGRILVESEPGRGSTFTIALPPRT